MTRAARLLQLLEVLRRHRAPVSGRTLADVLGISLRTLYRDVATLQSEGVHLDGAPGLGYLLRPGTVLPPLSFTSAEVDALVLGLRWVAARGDAHLRSDALGVLAKVAAVVPSGARQDIETSGLLIGPAEPNPDDGACLVVIRQSIREETKVRIGYRDAGASESLRTIWPFAIGYFDRARVIVAWCETRDAIRHFRSDRIVSFESTGCRYPKRRHALLREWREREGVDP